MAVPRTPLIVAKDITGRSLSSAASTALPTGSSANSELANVKGDDSGELTENEVERSLSEDLARGGSTMTRLEEKEEGESSSVAAVDANDTAPATTTPMAHHSHVSKKRARRRKKEELDGPHAMYAKKLKVRKSILSRSTCFFTHIQ
jgi:hypothetical protein